jgi:hypothetical protein
MVPPTATRPPPGRVDEALCRLAHATAPLQPNAIRVLLQLMGTAGQPPAKPNLVAVEAGCSAHTIRGLANQAREVARRAGPSASLLAADRLLAERIRSGPEAAMALYREGLTARVLHPATVLLALDWFGCTPSSAVCWLPNGTSLTVPSALESPVVRAPGRMRAWCLGQGITTVTELALRTELTDEVVVDLLDADPRFGRVGEQVWTVPDTGRNVVRFALHRQLAVRTHTVTDLHAGICAAMRIRPGQRPPSVEALHGYLQAQPGYRTRGDWVHAFSPAGPPIAATDDVIVRAFHAARANELSMSQLRRALTNAGFGESGGRHLVRGSPILRRTGYGRYTLSGVGRPYLSSGIGYK